MENTQNFYAELLETLHEGACMVDTNKFIVSWNKSAEKITSYKEIDILNKNCKDIFLFNTSENGTSLCGNENALSKVLSEGSIQETEVFLLHKEGRQIPVKVRVIPYKDFNAKQIGAILLFKHSSEKNAESEKINELVKLSFVDSITGLVNKKYTESKLSSLILEMKNSYIPLGILIFEITNLVEINTVYGSVTGDQLLKTIAQTLLKNASHPNVILCRWSGSQFMIIHSNAKRAVLFLLANKLKTLMEHAELSKDISKFEINVAIGGTIAKATDTLQSILNRANDMLDASKKDINAGVKIDS